jgi:hypothetical protein
MPFLINPYIYSTITPVPGCFYNHYGMNFIRTTTAANIELLKIDNKSNAIDTAIRDTTPNITVTGWFKLDAAANSTVRTLFSKYDPSNVGGNYRDVALLMIINASNRFEIYATANNLTTTTVSRQTTATYTSANGWVHFAFVYDSSQTVGSNIAKLYINGVEITSWVTNTVSTTDKYFQNQTTEADRANIRIGSALSASQTEDIGFGGELDEFTFWDKSLSAAEVTELYNSGNAYDVSLMSAYTSNCLAWWRMGDATGDNWDGSKWNIVNVKGTSSTDLISVNLVEADRITDVSPIGYPASIQSLSAYYNFDDNVNDSSGNALNGTATDITYSAGKYDNAANLNGTTSFVSVADNALLEGSSGNISVFGWIKITDYASDTAQHLASKWATTTGWRLVARPGDILITLGSTNIGRGTGVPTGDWVHIGFTYNGSTCKVYQNGVQVGTDASATATLANTQQMHIGKRSNGSDGFVKGQLDDVNVWQRVLTATEVSNLYNSTCPLKS